MLTLLCRSSCPRSPDLDDPAHKLHEAATRIFRPAAHLLLAALLGTAGCTTSAEHSVPCTGQRLIVAVAPGVPADDSSWLASVSRATDVELRFMRRLDEQHSLLCADDMAPGTELEQLLKQMADRPEVRSVEVDRVYKPLVK